DFSPFELSTRKIKDFQLEKNLIFVIFLTETITKTYLLLWSMSLKILVEIPLETEGKNTDFVTPEAPKGLTRDFRRTLETLEELPKGLPRLPKDSRDSRETPGTPEKLPKLSRDS